MKRIVSVICIVMLLASALMAAEDLTGKWSGSFTITTNEGTKDSTAYMVLKQSGTELTGTAGPSSDQQWEIQKGKIEGNKVTFEVKADEATMRFELTLVDGHLKGDAKAEREGRSMKAAVDLQRQKE